MLIVEDNPDHWNLMKKAAEHCLAEVETVHAHSEQEALRFLQDGSLQEWELPKLILLDLYLPKRENGWQLLQQIKSMPAPFNQIPVVVLSFSNSPEDIRQVYQYGGASYLIKPTAFQDWLIYFQRLRSYWWETVTLPQMRFYL